VPGLFHFHSDDSLLARAMKMKKPTAERSDAELFCSVCSPKGITLTDHREVSVIPAVSIYNNFCSVPTAPIGALH